MDEEIVYIEIPLSKTHEDGLKHMIKRLEWASRNFITMEKLLEYAELLYEAVYLTENTIDKYEFIPYKYKYRIVNPLDNLINRAMMLLQNLLYRWERNYVPVP